MLATHSTRRGDDAQLGRHCESVVVLCGVGGWAQGKKAATERNGRERGGGKGREGKGSPSGGGRLNIELCAPLESLNRSSLFSKRASF